MFKFYLYKLGQFIVTRLPLSLAYQFATFLSDLQYLFSFRDRRAVCNNLKIIVPSQQNLSAMTREVFRNFGQYLVEFFCMAKKFDMNFVKEKVKVCNIDILKKVLEQGKGGIILSAHIGNWEFGGILLSMLGYPLMIIALPHKERPVNDLFNHQRESRGITVVPPHTAIRRCLETLRSNKLVAIAADRDFTQSGVVMDFLGRKALIPKGAALFALKTGAPIVPCFLIRNPDNSFTLSLEEPIVPPLETDEYIKESILSTLMKQYTKVIEEKIRQFPTQWLMFREFWIK